MRTAGIQPGDTIEANVKGRVFPARVLDLACTEIPDLPIRVEPLVPATTFFHLAPSHVVRRLDPPPRKHRTTT